MLPPRTNSDQFVVAVLRGCADLLPEAYLKALTRLQDDVTPITWEEVEQTISEELGVSPQRAFAEINPQPLAAASLGQVHRGRLRDGREVVIKVQRPDIEPTVKTAADCGSTVRLMIV